MSFLLNYQQDSSACRQRHSIEESYAGLGDNLWLAVLQTCTRLAAATHPHIPQWHCTCSAVVAGTWDKAKHRGTCLTRLITVVKCPKGYPLSTTYVSKHCLQGAA